jgi:hypothetical protein
MGRKPATDLGENMGANTGENKLDTLAKHHQSASCRPFTPSKPPLRESFVSPLHKAVNGIGRKPATDLGENMGANTGKNKLDTLAKYHQSANCRAFLLSKPPFRESTIKSGESCRYFLHLEKSI